MQNGREQYGMQTFDQNLMDLVEEGVVDYHRALAMASNPSDFELNHRRKRQRNLPTLKLNIEGIYLPVTTPFASAGGVDLPSYESNLRVWLAEPIAGIVAAGSTGEAPLLEREEHLRLVESTSGRSSPEPGRNPPRRSSR